MGKNKTFKERYNGLIDVIEEALHEHIESKDYGRALTIAEDVAEKMYEDKRDVSNIFRFIAGMPLGTYLKNRKLEIAFSAKLKRKKLTWEEAGLMVYKDAASFKSAFRREYNMSVREAEKDPGLVNLTKPLYLDSVMKREEAVMNCNTYINKTAFTVFVNRKRVHSSD